MVFRKRSKKKNFTRRMQVKPLRILIVSSFFFPQQLPRAFRTTELAIELSKSGHDVTLAIPDANQEGLHLCNENGIKLVDLGPSSWKEIAIVGTGATRFLRRFLRRAAISLFEYPRIEIFFQISGVFKTQNDEFDLLISIASPHAVHWGVNRALRKNPKLAKIWIADCGDPYMGVTIDSVPRFFHFSFLEKSFCRRADWITVPIEGAKSGYYPEFREKIRVIPQGFRFPSPGELPVYNPHPIPHFAFAGTFIPGARDPRPILDYLCSLSVEFRFSIFTKQPDLVADYQKAMPGKVFLYDFVPRSELILQLCQMDFLLNIENGTDRQAPSKLIDYGISQRPILSLNSNDLDTAKIDQFLRGDYRLQTQIPDLDLYRIETVAGQFVELANQKISR